LSSYDTHIAKQVTHAETDFIHKKIVRLFKFIAKNPSFV